MNCSTTTSPLACETGLDPLALRHAFGSFATGVAVVTARHGDGQPMGMTINSFSSLSLSPALLLWSLAKHSRNHASMLTATRFAIHVLEASQQNLCRQFSGPPAHRFNGVTLISGQGEIPLLQDCLARFECRMAFHHDGGDHSIIIGQIERFDVGQGQPLLYDRGSTTRLENEGP